METKAGKIRVEKTKRKREERERGKETREERTEKKRKEKTKKERMIEVKKVVEEWEIWDEKEEAKRLVPRIFHKWFHIFGKKASERIPTRKV